MNNDFFIKSSINFTMEIENAFLSLTENNTNKDIKNKASLIIKEYMTEINSTSNNKYTAFGR